jgi:hybrid cluster-associated redox disulfide protein
MNLDSKMTVSELIKAHQSAMDVFIKRKMLCVGCPAETFHTLEDVARIYCIALEALMKELRETIEDQGK